MGVPCDSQNRQRLFPSTALTSWSLSTRRLVNSYTLFRLVSASEQAAHRWHLHIYLHIIAFRLLSFPQTREPQCVKRLISIASTSLHSERLQPIRLTDEGRHANVNSWTQHRCTRRLRQTFPFVTWTLAYPGVNCNSLDIKHATF
jgi:hypothetical protein